MEQQRRPPTKFETDLARYGLINAFNRYASTMLLAAVPENLQRSCIEEWYSSMKANNKNLDFHASLDYLEILDSIYMELRNKYSV